MIIRDKDRENLIKIFNSIDYSFEVWAYGSRVNNTAHEGSDLDLVLRNKNLNTIPIDILSQIIDKVRQSNIPILVEIRDWSRLPSSFHENILENYEVLFSNL